MLQVADNGYFGIVKIKFFFDLSCDFIGVIIFIVFCNDDYVEEFFVLGVYFQEFYQVFNCSICFWDQSVGCIIIDSGIQGNEVCVLFYYFYKK